MRRRRAATGLGLAILLGTTMPATPADPVLAVVVHPERSETLAVEDVARIYLRKRRLWNDGSPIVALNREARSEVRALFSRRVLGSDPSALETYWNEQYFHGIFPPVVLSSSAAVKRYVAGDRNAIGYVEWGDVDDSVRVVLRIEGRRHDDAAERVSPEGDQPSPPPPPRLQN